MGKSVKALATKQENHSCILESQGQEERTVVHELLANHYTCILAYALLGKC